MMISEEAKNLENELNEIIARKALNNLIEKWGKDVEIHGTGEHAGKTIGQLKAQIHSLRGKPGNKEKMGELLFALRAKQGWKKKTGV